MTPVLWVKTYQDLLDPRGHPPFGTVYDILVPVPGRSQDLLVYYKNDNQRRTLRSSSGASATWCNIHLFQVESLTGQSQNLFVICTRHSKRKNISTAVSLKFTQYWKGKKGDSKKRGRFEYLTDGTSKQPICRKSHQGNWKPTDDQGDRYTVFCLRKVSPVQKSHFLIQ